METLGKDLSDTTLDEGATREIVIRKALDILSSIHTAFTTPANDEAGHIQTGNDGNVALEDAKRRRMLHALLDLISLEGIYPSLSAGVGVPLQQRVISVLPAGVIAKQASSHSDTKPNDELLLDQVLTVLCDIVFDVRPSIQPVIRGRILSDMISGASDLAFNSKNLSPGKKHRHEGAFAKIVEEYAFVLSCFVYTKNLQDPKLRSVTNTIQLPSVQSCVLV